MDVLTSETCLALSNEIIKQVTSSWSIFIQLQSHLQIHKLNYNETVILMQVPCIFYTLTNKCITILQIITHTGPARHQYKEYVYRDTSANEDNSFRNHIR